MRTMLATPEPTQLENVLIAVPLHDDGVGAVAESKSGKHCNEVAHI